MYYVEPTDLDSDAVSSQDYADYPADKAPKKRANHSTHSRKGYEHLTNHSSGGGED